MNKKKKLLQEILIICVMVIGVYMLIKYEFPTPPAVSGLGFLMAGFAMWIPHCPIMRMFLKD